MQAGIPHGNLAMPPAGPMMPPYAQDPNFNNFAHPSNFQGMAPMGYMNQMPFVPPNQIGFDNGMGGMLQPGIQPGMNPNAGIQQNWQQPHPGLPGTHLPQPMPPPGKNI